MAAANTVFTINPCNEIAFGKDKIVDMRTRPLILFILVFGLFSCKKDPIAQRPEFVGQWNAETNHEGDRILLDISENSNIVVDYYYDGSTKHYEGTARVNDKKLKISDTKYFDIIEYPHRIDTNVERVSIYIGGSSKLANWKMVLEGMKPNCLHVSGKWTYYKVDY